MRNVIQAGILTVVFSFVSSLYAQGTISFYNRQLTSPLGGTYNAPIVNFSPDAKAQLFLVLGGPGLETYTPLEGIQTFRPPPNHEFFKGPLQVTVPGQAPGTTGVRFVVRVWEGASWDNASFYGQSGIVTVHAPLGGSDPLGGPPFLPPDLGGPDGLQTWVLVPEPRLFGFAMLAVAGLLLRRRK